MTRLFAATALSLCLALPAQAFDLAAMTDAERAAFRAEVRAFLLENPEVLTEAISVLEQRQQDQSAANDTALLQTNAAAIFNDPASWSGGNPKGDITVVEFMDYRCGYCKKAHDEVAELIKSDGNIRFVIKEFPILGDESVLASKYAIAVLQVAGEGPYKSVHDAMIKLRSDVTPDALARLSTTFGLDHAAISARMETPEVAAVINANHQLADVMQINGTPTFVVQGTMLRGYVPLDGMRKVVEDERKG
jgi:protein-disulfide isomerase